MELSKELARIKKEHRDIVLIGVTAEQHARLLKTSLETTFNVADFIIDLVDSFIEEEEYKQAVEYGLQNYNHDIETLSGLIWRYFEEEKGTSLDWYYMDRISAIISELFKNKA
ncbi:MAG: hypothetical protein ACK5DE_14045 [Bacteroidota bacterium]|jgi:hypothetical protein